MRAIAGCIGMILVAAASGGCLRKEVTHTIYLAPSGAVWSVLERDVRSDEHEPADRAREEDGYAAAAATGEHPVAEALRRLGALAVTTTWLRRERPYAVLAEGRFDDLRHLVLAIIDAAHVRGDVEQVRAGCEVTFTARLGLESAAEADGGSPLDDLLNDLKDYRIVLTEGRFLSADGFAIRDEGMVSVIDERKTAADGVLTLALAWEDQGCVVR